MHGYSRSRARVLTAGGGVVDSDRSRGSLNPTEGLCQRGAVAAIEVDVVAGRVGDVESDRLANDEGDRFGLELPRVS